MLLLIITYVLCYIIGHGKECACCPKNIPVHTLLNPFPYQVIFGIHGIDSRKGSIMEPIKLKK
ncbi:unnamed protein product, partial [Vitis vinifera]